MFLREAGYSIAIALIDNTPEVAKQRALSRFMKEGRYASDSYIEAPECSAKHQAPAVALTIDSNIVKSCQCEISEHGEHDDHEADEPDEHRYLMRVINTMIVMDTWCFTRESYGGCPVGSG